MSKKILVMLAFLTLSISVGAQKLSHGQASYYASKFHGRRTASGEIFNNGAMVCAHRTLPFGTRVKVTNKRNGKSVVVRVVDRGPYAKGRVIDLSQAAARQLGMISSGVASVHLEVMPRNNAAVVARNKVSVPAETPVNVNVEVAENSEQNNEG